MGEGRKESVKHSLRANSNKTSVWPAERIVPKLRRQQSQSGNHESVFKW